MSKIKLSKNFIDDRVKLALAEDLYPDGDVTSDLLQINKIVTAKIISNQKAIIAGLSFAKQAFAKVDNKVKILIKKKDGTQVEKGDVIAVVEGKAIHICS